ncbi:MAG TPA: hydroxymethylbilane synthase [Mycobacteriales bacterium]|nr:hydroxymethylbilane synthase [Mycobacteriales bacterium]
MTGTATTSLRVGTRRSTLARAQAGSVGSALTAATGRPVELRPSLTDGDRSAARLTDIGGTGVFVAALRDRLLAGEVDVVVHSAKDLPAIDHPGLVIAAVPAREDPRDVLVAAGRTLAELPDRARIGTGSPRRAAQLRALRPQLDIVPLRGNVDTRLRRVAPGDLDAVLLARAGLLRLGRSEAAGEIFEPERMMPAPGQGALAVECRADDEGTRLLLREIDHPASHVAVRAERALLAALGAGCSAPVGALATVVGADSVTGPRGIQLSAVVVSHDGTRVLRLSTTGPVDDPDRAGQRLAAAFLAAGAADLMES